MFKKGADMECDDIMYVARLTGDALRGFPSASQGNLINFNDENLYDLLVDIEDNDRSTLVKGLLSFSFYVKNVKYNEEKAGVAPIWTNFVLIVLFGLVEKIMSNHEYVPFFNFINKRKEQCNNGQTQDVIDEWIKKYGANEKMRKFFKDYITEDEKKQILTAIAKDNTFNDLDDFIKKVIDYRSKFVHCLGLDCINPSDNRSELVPDDEGELTTDSVQGVPTLSIDKLVKYVIKGVLRKYDKHKILKELY